MNNDAIQRAYEAAYKQYALPLTQYAYRMLEGMGDSRDTWDKAQDIVQETFLDTFESQNIANLIKKEDHLRNYLYHATRNKVIDFARRAKKVSSYDQSSADNSGLNVIDQADPIEAALGRIYTEEFRVWLFNCLSSTYKDTAKAQYHLNIIDLRVIRDMSWAEVADTLGKKEATVKRDWSRTRGWLQIRLKDARIL